MEKNQREREKLIPNLRSKYTLQGEAAEEGSIEAR